MATLPRAPDKSRFIATRVAARPPHPSCSPPRSAAPRYDRQAGWPGGARQRAAAATSSREPPASAARSGGPPSPRNWLQAMGSPTK
jgi:hypothetical protein